MLSMSSVLQLTMRYEDIIRISRSMVETQSVPGGGGVLCGPLFSAGSNVAWMAHVTKWARPIPHPIFEGVFQILSLRNQQ